MRSTLLCAVVLLLGALPALARGGPASIDSFRDWVVACDQHLICQAVGASEYDDGWLIVTRTFGEPENWELEIGALQGDLTGALLSIDGVPQSGVATALPAKPGEDFPKMRLGFNSAATRTSFLEALKAGSEMTIDVDGETIGRVSLSGMSASLLWMDEALGLLGTPQAFIGSDRPLSHGSGPVVGARSLDIAMPREVSDVPAAAQALHDRNEECEASMGENWDPILAGQPDGGVLVGLPCFSGAYNYIYAFYIARNGQAEPLNFPQVTGGGGFGGPNLLVNPGLGQNLLMLSAFAKGRGIGDCGESASYAWQPGGWVVVEYQSMPLCHGIAPEAWPYVIRSAWGAG